MTDTDLNVITAGESTDSNQQSDSVTTNNQDGPTTASVDKGAGSLSTMVLPELRALANRAGVKGTSGMRKNELIAAIQETRGQANGASTTHAPSAQNHQESSESAPAPSSDAPAAQGEQNDSANSGAEGPRRERRGGSREAGSSTRSDGETPAEKSEKNENRRGGQQDTKTDDRGSDRGGDQSGDQQGSGGQQGRRLESAR